MSNYTLTFTEAELETILAMVDDYVHYSDPDADPEDLIGGIPVEERCSSIRNNIFKAFEEAK